MTFYRQHRRTDVGIFDESFFFKRDAFAAEETDSVLLHHLQSAGIDLNGGMRPVPANAALSGVKQLHMAVRLLF